MFIVCYQELARRAYTPTAGFDTKEEALVWGNKMLGEWFDIIKIPITPTEPQWYRTTISISPGHREIHSRFEAPPLLETLVKCTVQQIKDQPDNACIHIDAYHKSSSLNEATLLGVQLIQDAIVSGNIVWDEDSITKDADYLVGKL